MNISVNGEKYELRKRATVDDLLVQLGLSSEKVMACAVDGMIVKKDEWTIFELSEGQKVELLNFVGGG